MQSKISAAFTYPRSNLSKAIDKLALSGGGEKTKPQQQQQKEEGRKEGRKTRQHRFGPPLRGKAGD